MKLYQLEKGDKFKFMDSDVIYVFNGCDGAYGKISELIECEGGNGYVHCYTDVEKI